MNAVAYTSNLSYSGGDEEGLGSKPAPGKKLVKTPSQPIKEGMVPRVCHLSYVGNRRMIAQANPGINTRPYWKNN
jgi:hypothetical protein